MLLLLYAQPLVKVVTLQTSIVDDSDAGISITLGQHPTDVPEPFASLIREHLAARSNLRTGAGHDSPWIFPAASPAATCTPPRLWTDASLEDYDLETTGVYRHTFIPKGGVNLQAPLNPLPRSR